MPCLFVGEEQTPPYSTSIQPETHPPAIQPAPVGRETLARLLNSNRAQRCCVFGIWCGAQNSSKLTNNIYIPKQHTIYVHYFIFVCTIYVVASLLLELEIIKGVSQSREGARSLSSHHFVHVLSIIIVAASSTLSHRRCVCCLLQSGVAFMVRLRYTRPPVCRNKLIANIDRKVVCWRLANNPLRGGHKRISHSFSQSHSPGRRSPGVFGTANTNTQRQRIARTQAAQR